ncbi:MAG: hypothetical protein IPM82_27775 [Saprospiraceae bacterium]|nr:hypothetical protein [Saprospiraceae bacterium]
MTPEQAAVLVGMLKATTAYHPVKNPERSKERGTSCWEGWKSMAF